MKATYSLVIAIASVLTGSTLAVRAEEKPAAPSPTARAEAFLSRVAKGEVDEALDDLVRGSLLLEKPMEVAALKGQIRTGVGLYGGHLGTELVREVKTKDAVIHLVYLSKQEKAPLTWHFLFYKPHDEWKLQGISFNDRIQGLEE